MSQTKGFTLIEIMVASSIFIIVMFIAVGAIISLSGANRKAQAFSSVVSNLNISLDSMVRDIRTGSNYSVTNQKTKITFTSSTGYTTSYQLVSGAIQKNVKNGSNTIESGPITAPNVNITNLTFNASGIGIDQTQPRILLQIQGNVATTSTFTIQTEISQRVLEETS